MYEPSGMRGTIESPLTRTTGVSGVRLGMSMYPSMAAAVKRLLQWHAAGGYVYIVHRGTLARQCCGVIVGFDCRAGVLLKGAHPRR